MTNADAAPPDQGTNRAVPSDPLVAGSIGRYPIDRLIGRGGMAVVYAGRHPGLDRVVAVKVLHPHLASDPAFAGRFRQEAAIVARLNHPNIVRVYDFDVVDGRSFMVMEYVDGPSLAEVLSERAKSGRTLSGHEILQIFPPLCAAIDAAGAHGLVHRDIKPANIMLTGSGEPVLTDYGIAKIAGASRVTTPGMIVGTPQYMAPEQAQGQPCDLRTDLYALGVVLYESLIGAVPFDGETTASVLAQHLTAAVPPLSHARADLPPALDDVVRTALAKQPHQRFQSGAEFAAALRKALEVTGADAATVIEPATAAPTIVEPGPPLAAVTPMSPPAPPPVPALQPGPRPLMVAPRTHGSRPAARTRWLVGGAAAVLVTVALVAVGLTRRGSPSSTNPSQSTLAAGAADRLVEQGDALLAAGSVEFWLDRFEAALAAAPNHDRANTHLGIALLLRRDTSGAEARFIAATRANPNDASGFAFLGLARLALAENTASAQYDPAEAALAEALRLDPGSAVAHAFLAELRLDQARAEEAQAEVGRALQLDPDDPWVLRSTGFTTGRLGDWSAGVANVQRAVDRQPNWAYLQLSLAEALQRVNRLDEALFAAQRAFTLDQGWQAFALKTTGNTQRAKRDFAGAVESYRASLLLDDRDDHTHFGLGVALFELGDPSAALVEFQRAIELTPNEASFHDWAAAALERLQRLSEAKVQAQQALELQPDLASARQRLEQLTALGY